MAYSRIKPEDFRRLIDRGVIPKKIVQEALPVPKRKALPIPTRIFVLPPLMAIFFGFVCILNFVAGNHAGGVAALGPTFASLTASIFLRRK